MIDTEEPMEEPMEETMATPDTESLRREAMQAGAMDPMALQFRIVAYDKFSGERLGVRDQNITFADAVKIAAGLIRAQQHLHLQLEPIGFIQ